MWYGDFQIFGEFQQARAILGVNSQVWEYFGSAPPSDEANE
jgi:hypothetical protein